MSGKVSMRKAGRHFALQVSSRDFFSQPCIPFLPCSQFSLRIEQEKFVNMINITFVIPCYNEEERIEKTFDALKAFRAPRDLKVIEVIFVDDGSTDDTFRKINDFGVKNKELNIKVVSYKPNKGKGNAVKVGLLEAKSDYVLFFDADISTPLSEIDKFISFMKNGEDVVIGTRKNGKSTVLKHQPKLREFMGRVFTKITQISLGVPTTDFTCGFKLFSKKAIKSIFTKAQIDGWGYDAEIVYLANRDFKVNEMPVLWINDERTHVVIYKAIPQTLYDLLRINWIHGVKPSIAFYAQKIYSLLFKYAPSTR